MLLVAKNFEGDFSLHKFFTFYCLAVDFIADHVTICKHNHTIRCLWVDKASRDCPGSKRLFSTLYLLQSL